MKGKSLSKKAIIAIIIIAILVIAAISMVVVFLRDQGETEATAIGENSSNSEQTQDAVPENNGDNNNQGTATQSEEPQQEEQPTEGTTVADNDTTTATNVGTTAPVQQTTTTATDDSQTVTTETTVTTPTENVNLGWSNITVSGGEQLVDVYALNPELVSELKVNTTEILNQKANIEYTLTISNNSEAINAEAIIVTMNVPEGTKFVSAENGKYDEDTNKVTWTVNVNAGTTLELKLVVESDIYRGEITNVAVVDGVETNEVITTVDDNIAPEIIFDEGTAGVDPYYRKVDFKFHDNWMLKEYELNGTLFIVTPNQWSDGNYNNIKPYLEEGENTITVRDMAGNETTKTFIYDSIAPVVNIAGTGVNGYYRSDVKVTIEEVNIQDAKVLHNGKWTSIVGNEATFTEEGTYFIRVTDKAYNKKAEVTFTIDKTAPVIKLEGTGVNNNFRSDVKAIIEEANVHNIKYRKNDERWITVNEKELTFTDEGTYTIEVIDQAYNRAEVTFTIDKTAPVIKLEGTGVNNNFRSDVKAVIEEANVHNIKYRKNDERWITVNEKELPFTEEGTYTIEVIDQAYNRIEVTFTIDKTNPIITPTEDSIGNKDEMGNEYYSKVGFTVTDNYGVASYKINNETVVITDGDANYETIRKYLKDGKNIITAVDKAGNDATYEFYYRSSPAKRLATNILKNGETNEKSEYYVKPGDEIYMYISFDDKLAHNPTFTLINNGKEYIMDNALVKVSGPKGDNNRYDYSVIYEIPKDVEFADGEITLKVSNLEDIYGNKIADETKPTNSHKVYFDKTKPKLTGVADGTYTREDVKLYAEDANVGTIHLSKDGELIKNYVWGTALTEEGHYTAVLSDKAGNKSEKISFTIDKTAPKIEGAKNGEFYNTSVTVKIIEENVKTSTYSFNGRGAYPINGSATFTKDGVYSVHVVDLAHNKHADITFTIDTTKPTITGVANNAYYRKSVTPNVTDENIEKVTLTRDGKEIAYNVGDAVSEEGKYVLTATDKANNTETVTFTIDTSAPKVTIEGEQKEGIYYGTVTVRIDEKNIQTSICRRTNGGEWNISDGDTLSTPGDYHIHVVDLAHNKHADVYFTIAE